MPAGETRLIGDSSLPLRSYASKTEVVSSTGHVRYVPGPMAQAMVKAGHAIIENQDGKIRSIRLTQCATASLVRIGEPTGLWGGVRFTRWIYLDCGIRVIEHHPRCTY